MMFLQLSGATNRVVIDFGGEKYGFPGEQKLSCEIINFNDYHTWFSSIKKEARSQIRQAKKKGVFRAEFKDEELLPLIQDTNARHGGGQEMESLKKVIGFGKRWGAFVGRKLIGAVVTYEYKNKLYLVKNVSLSKYLDYRPNHFLYNAVVEYGCMKGFTSLNSGGSEQEGLRNFKRSLGSKEKTYYLYQNGG